MVMNMLLKRISILLLLTISMAGAYARPGGNREERQQQRSMERNENQDRRSLDQQQYRVPDSGGQPADDGSRRHGRMSPEERRALRRQINEAGQDIYITKP